MRGRAGAHRVGGSKLEHDCLRIGESQPNTNLYTNAKSVTVAIPEPNAEPQSDGQADRRADTDPSALHRRQSGPRRQPTVDWRHR